MLVCRAKSNGLEVPFKFVRIEGETVVVQLECSEHVQVDMCKATCEPMTEAKESSVEPNTNTGNIGEYEMTQRADAE